MSGPFIELTDSDTSRLMLINADRVICVAPHGRGGSFVYVAGSPERLEAEETPGRVSEILQVAGVAYSSRERQE